MKNSRSRPGIGPCQLPAFIEKYNARRLQSSLGYLSPEQYEKQHDRPPVKDAA
jgi:putative transposase